MHVRWKVGRNGSGDACRWSTCYGPPAMPLVQLNLLTPHPHPTMPYPHQPSQPPPTHTHPTHSVFGTRAPSSKDV